VIINETWNAINYRCIGHYNRSLARWRGCKTLKRTVVT